jgi:putative glutathione S-transferase
MFNSLRRTSIIVHTASPFAARKMATDIPKSVHSGPDDSWHGVIDNSPTNPFQPEKGRYHMYIGLFCPFAHRANLVRHLKGLQDFIDISIVKPYPKGNDKGWPGWQFPESDNEYPNATVDKLFGSKYLHEVYFKADKEYKGRYSVPLLWDKKTNTAVNNV